MVSELELLSMASNTETTSSSSSHCELSPMEDPRSPFFLHHGPLIEDNYPTLARAMRMALDAKSKLGFVDGSHTKPSSPADISLWERCNDMVLSWILNSIDKFIVDSLI